MKKIGVYFHVCMINNWLDIFHETIELLQKSNLLVQSNIFKIIIVNANNELPYELSEYKKHIYYGGSIQNYEYPTLKTIWDDCKNDNVDQVLYIHTKGVSRHNSKVKDWRNFMQHYCISKWNDCVKELDNHDAVGVNLQYGRYREMESKWFAGNFWWANASYIKKLPMPSIFLKDRLMAEYWLGMNLGNFHTMKDSNTNHYIDNYQKEKWI